MKLKSALISAAMVPFLAACATSTPYIPASEGRYGYSETQIESDRFTVSFSGNSLTDLKTVENYLLYRAAELTQQNGYDHFIVVERKVEADRKLQSTGMDTRPFSPMFSYQYYHPRFGWRHHYDPFFNDVTLREVTRYEAIAEILIRKGAKPGDNAKAYTASEVIASLGPVVLGPDVTS